ncbi:MAG: hypothetical protein CMA64_09575 [Euryarchaeota archaeon]|nr:hypothetical protein [Euryarchaeota archaeon]
MEHVVNYFKESYRLSPFAFYCELGEAIVLIIGSAVLSFTILNPATHIFVPLYLVGSILGLISTYIRRSSAIVLISWFVAMNFWAFLQLFII